MDAEKDKSLPEKDKEDNNSSNPEKPNADSDLPIAADSGIKDEEEPAKNADDREPGIEEENEPAEKAGEAEPIKEEKEPAEIADAPDSEIKEEKEPDEKTDGDETEIKDEEKTDETNAEEEAAPPSPLDLGKLSDEIDQFIRAISTPKDDESTPPDVPNFIEQFGGMVETKIADYDSGDTTVKWSELSEEDKASFLEMVNRVSSLSKSLSQFSSEEKYASAINQIGGVLQRAMSYVEEAFKSLLEEYKIQESDPNETKPKQPPSNEESEQTPADESEPAPVEENYFPGYPEEVSSDLIRLSKIMRDSGRDMECHEAYSVERRKAWEDSLQKQGFEKHSIEDVQKMPWETLEREIGIWMRTFKHSSAHFSSEQKLCTALFPEHPSISESLFCELSICLIIQLIDFARAVALTKRSSEKLFKLLDIYETIRDILPQIDNLFPEDIRNDLRREFSMLLTRLGEEIISVFSELETSIKAESGKTPVPGGAVHPLTRYIVNYLQLAGAYIATLEQVYKEHQKIERADSATGSDFNYESQPPTTAAPESARQSPFQAQMIKIMDLLDENLDLKSKLYKDHSLSSIFLMNNGRYILQKVRGSSEINALMGDAWCRKKSTDLRQYHKAYQRETWGRLLSCLTQEGLMSHGKVSKPVLKERFKSFNAMFDEIHRTQSTWVVCDEQLQSELRVSISNMVIPAYRSYLARYSQVFTPGRQTEKYVKYQAEDIETYIDELFDGKK